MEDEIRRATKLLETVMQATGLTRKDLDQKLGAGPGYVSQVLTGRMELKLRHILAILRALDIEPGLFFQTLYPEARPATDQTVMEEFLKRFQRLGSVGAAPRAGVQPSQGPSPPLSASDLERLIQSAVRTALSEQSSPGSWEEGQDAESGRTEESAKPEKEN